jgi:SAM-dependent methyltransferase
MKSMVRLSAIVSLVAFTLGCTRSEPPVKSRPAAARTMPAATPVNATTSQATPSEQAAAESTSAEQVAGQTAPQAAESEANAADAPPTRTPDVVYVPTPQPVVDKMLELVKPKKSDVVYDLGCGDGRIVVTAAKKYGTKAYGFDIDPARIAEARENVRKNKVEHLVTIEQKDIFTLDLSPADIVTLYLLPKLNVKLIPQLQKLKPGARIVSHDFDMQGVSPLKHLTMNPAGEGREHEIYLWRSPIQLDSEKATGTRSGQAQ